MPAENRFLRQGQVLLVRRLRACEQLDFRVDAVQAEIVLRELGLVQQPRIRHVRRRRLGGREAGRHAAPHASPEIRLPRHVERQREAGLTRRAGIGPGDRRASGRDRGRRGDRREQRGASHACRGPGLPVLRLGLRHILVRHADLLLERIEGGIVVELPPAALRVGIAGVRLLPPRRFRFLEVHGRLFFECRRRDDGRLLVDRAHGASR